MARRSYVVSYDVSDDKRRNAVFRTLQGYGDHVQFSVFVCELNGVEVSEMRATVRNHINMREDQVLIIDLGSTASAPETCIEAVGKAYQPHVRTIVV